MEFTVEYLKNHLNEKVYKSTPATWFDYMGFSRKAKRSLLFKAAIEDHYASQEGSIRLSLEKYFEKDNSKPPVYVIEAEMTRICNLITTYPLLLSNNKLSGDLDDILSVFCTRLNALQIFTDREYRLV